MTRASFPEIPQEALKSQAQPERVERVWRRLELDVAAAPRGRSGALWWMPLTGLGIFGLGVLVGARWHAPQIEVAAVAEPRPALPAPGAGPAPEPQTSAAAHRAAPVQKRAHATHVSATDGAVGDYTESYAEPALTAASEPLPVVTGPAEWEKLAETGDARAAKAALDREGGFALVSQRASASQLLVLADIARASGSREQAAQALKRVLSSYLSAPEAPLAAWTLGNLLEQAGDRAGADAAYATYRRLSPTGDFAEDAAARQVDAALSQGNVELAARALEEYSRNYPEGRRLAELHKRFAALAAPAEAGVSAPSDADDDDTDATEPNADAPAAPAQAAPQD